MRSKFKNSNNMLVTRALFIDTADSKEYAVYTLRDEDFKGYPSLYRLYMEMMDVTEYEFATTYLHSWSHWQSISNASWFKEYIDRWRTELELKLQVRAIKEIMHEASAGGKNAFAANKWLVDKSWIDKSNPRGRGRPTKQSIRQAAMETVLNDNRVLEDIKRLGIN